MGEIIHLSCEKCDFKKQLRIGAGMLSIRAFVVEENLLDEDLQDWKRLQEQDKIGFFSWQYDLAYCDSCHDFQSIFDVNIKTKEDEQIRLGGRCDTCHKQLQPLPKGVAITCPRCGNTDVRKMRVGMWD